MKKWWAYLIIYFVSNILQIRTYYWGGGALLIVVILHYKTYKMSVGSVFIINPCYGTAATTLLTDGTGQDAVHMAT